MEAEVSLRKRLDELPESSRYNSAEFWSAPIAPVETPAPVSIKVSVRVPARYQDENDPPELSQHDLYGSQRSFGSNRTLITGIAVVLALGLSALVYFFMAPPSEKTTTQTAELAPSVPYPPATTAEVGPRAAPAVTTASEPPAVATPTVVPVAAARPHSPSLTNSEGPPDPVQVFPKVAQGGDVLYLQRPGVNIRSTPSPTGRAVGTAPKGTRFKVTNRQGDWIQVESGRLKGWINAGFLAPSEPR
jgi:Bacterial SH3 domain